MLINQQSLCISLYHLSIIFLDLVVEHEKKAHICDNTRGAEKKAVREQLARRSRPTFRTLILASQSIFY